MNKTLYIDNFAFWTENDMEKLPDVSFIPPMLRRRMSALEKIAISLAARVAPESLDYQVIFASRFGEWEQTIKLIRQFYEDKEMSPAGFSNSVHNASMGHLSLLTHNKNSYTSIAGGEKTIENALLTALISTKPVLFVYAEEHNPAEYEHLFEKPAVSHGCALFITQTGKNKFELSANNQTSPVLTFEKLQNLFEHEIEIQTSNWFLTRK